MPIALDGSLTSVKSNSAESSACRDGPVERYTGRILVEDAQGVQQFVHEFRGRRTFLPAKRYMLDTGEHVRRVDECTFVIAATGERPTRIDKSD